MLFGDEPPLANRVCCVCPAKGLAGLLCGRLEVGWQLVYDLDRVETDGDDLAWQAHDVLGVVVAVGVRRDAAAFVGADLVLADDPFQREKVGERGPSLARCEKTDIW